jgi:hypothetical protein
VILWHRADCTVVVDDIVDTSVVEVPENVAAARTLFGSIAKVSGWLWEALFPIAHAQSYASRRMYHHIHTCGAACAGGIDGLTAQQGWMDYRYNTLNARMDGAWGWACTAGTKTPGVSWCQPPMEIAAAPMAPVNTGWAATNFWIVERVWGPASQVRAADQSDFFWAPWPATQPRSYQHRLSSLRFANYNGTAGCSSGITGSWVNGPIRSSCIVTVR